MLLRPQPVEPLSLMVCRSKPPTNEPQVILAALSRSPMFLEVIVAAMVVLEQVSPAGSRSPTSVKPPWPSGTAAPAAARSGPMAAIVLGVPGGRRAGERTGTVKPLVWPENISSAPGVDGPNVSLQELSLIAKFCA